MQIKTKHKQNKPNNQIIQAIPINKKKNKNNNSIVKTEQKWKKSK